MDPAGPSPANHFLHEARDTAWAAETERQVTELIENDLGQLSRDIRIELECRTTMCRARWSAPAGLRHIVDLWMMRLYLGAAGGPTAANEAVFVYRGAFPGGHADTPEESLALVRAQREQALRAIHTGKDRRALSRLSADKWPQAAAP